MKKTSQPSGTAFTGEYGTVKRFGHTPSFRSYVALTVLGLFLMPVALTEAQAGQTHKLPPGANTEQEIPADMRDLPFAISVDGESVSGARPVDAQRKTDLALEAMDIQVKFDGLEVKPMLNVSTAPIRQAYRAGDEVTFFGSLNYGGWVKRAEVRILDLERPDATPLARVNLDQNLVGRWTMPGDGPARLAYVLRVYDDEGRFDETRARPLSRTTEDFVQHQPQDASVAPGYAEDNTALRNIPVYGGAVTVYGSHVPKGNGVQVLGEAIPVDLEGAFVVQRILPPGSHDVTVDVVDEKGRGLDFSRQITIPESDWFYVAMADLTVGYRKATDHIEDVKPGEYDKVTTRGRLAYYVKGKIKGRYLLTSALDTGEDDIENVFRGLDAKDPRQFLRRIDPDDYYPVYGDDSTVSEDAPTRGKFYVRLERGASHAMWGNFKTRITGTQFLRNERALYGASVVVATEKQAPDGGATGEIHAYAAEPGTMPQVDVLRGTGGSVYFLKHQDITLGSETVTVEVRDPVTGVVQERRPLRYGHDYDVDYMQGMILLKSPLSSTTGGAGAVRSSAIGGSEVYLVVAYEYTPASTQVKGLSVGGRAQQWLGDHLRLGVTAARENTGPAEQRLYGADVRVQKSERTYVEAEVARTKGPGFGNSISTDGGLTINDQGTAGTAGVAANAWRLRGRADVAELSNGALKGDAEAYYEHRGAGFSSFDQQVVNKEDIWGAKADLDVSERVGVGAAYAERRVAQTEAEREVEGHLDFHLNDQWTVSPGVMHNRRRDYVATPRTDDQGSRTDVGMRLTYQPDDDHKAYVFGQTTVDRSGNRRRNDRGGLGGEINLTEKTSLAAEASYGSLGWGGLASINYRPTADDHYYLGYRLDPDREFDSVLPSLYGNDLGAIVSGARHRFSESVSAFTEGNYDMFGQRRSLTQTYGVEYTPDARWTLAAAMEQGRIRDRIDSDFDRTALSLSAGYKGENGVSAHGRGEVRLEDSDDDSRDRTTWAGSAGATVEMSDNWRMIASADALFSDATSTILDGRYFEGSLGYTYRPVDNDRFNALFKYTFLYDLPGPDQVTVNGTTLGPQQITHILSADASYDINRYVTLGAKYGFRIGETRSRAGGSWDDSSAHLGVVRADLHVVHNWDALLEGRVLWSPTDETADWGALAAIYRHMGDNFKVGVGYNFGRFSDDLRDQTFDDRGVFLNVLGKF